MTEFVNFLKDYGEYILTAISAILCLIAIIVKRKPKTLDEFLSIVSEVINIIPSMVIQAEQFYGDGNGERKRDYVISWVLKLVSSRLGRSLSINEVALIKKKASSSIEDVLSAPEKKKE